MTHFKVWLMCPSRRSTDAVVATRGRCQLSVELVEVSAPSKGYFINEKHPGPLCVWRLWVLDWHTINTLITLHHQYFSNKMFSWTIDQLQNEFCFSKRFCRKFALPFALQFQKTKQRDKTCKLISGAFCCQSSFITS